MQKLTKFVLHCSPALHVTNFGVEPVPQALLCRLLLIVKIVETIPIVTVVSKTILIGVRTAKNP